MKAPEHDDLAVAISAADQPRARDEFRAQLRRRVIMVAQHELRTPQRRAARFVVAPRFALAAALLAAVIGASGGIAAAASLPGDPAFAVKMAIEQVEIALATDDAARVEVLARQSERRLDELAKTTTARPATAPTTSAQYQTAVEQFRAAVDKLVVAPSDDKREAARVVAERAAAKHIAVLEALRQRHDTPGLERALEQAHEIEERAKDAKDKNRKRPANEQRVSPSPSPSRSPSPRPSPSASPRQTERP